MNHYETIGLKPGATVDEIKAALRRASSEAHPDKNQGVDTTARMQAINAARECLLDPDKRFAYDNYGDEQFVADDAAVSNVEHMISEMLECGFEGRDWVEMMKKTAEAAIGKTALLVDEAKKNLRRYERSAGAIARGEGKLDVFQRIYDAGLQKKRKALSEAKCLEASAHATLKLVLQLKPGEEFMHAWERARSPDASHVDTLMRLNNDIFRYLGNP